jgi:hypothetical protein
MMVRLFGTCDRNACCRRAAKPLAIGVMVVLRRGCRQLWKCPVRLAEPQAIG